MDRIKLEGLPKLSRILFTHELSARKKNLACPWALDICTAELCFVGTTGCQPTGCQPIGWGQRGEYNPRWDEEGVVSIVVMYEFTDGEKFWAHHNMPDSMCVEDFDVHGLKTPDRGVA